jgi:hypothetical protein
MGAREVPVGLVQEISAGKLMLLVALAVIDLVGGPPGSRTSDNRSKERLMPPRLKAAEVAAERRQPRPRRESGPDVRTLHLAVHGVTFRNYDGSSRQGSLRRCVKGEPILLIPEPSNPIDREAVMVCRKTGEQLGYLPRDSGLAATIRNGEFVSATLDRVTWGEPGNPVLGAILNISVLW